MVKFLKDGSLLALVEQPNWVCLQENGAYGLCGYESAQGVAINGIGSDLLSCSMMRQECSLEAMYWSTVLKQNNCR